MRLYGLILLLLSCQLSWAADSKPEPTTDIVPSITEDQNETVSKNVWLHEVSMKFPEKLCAPETEYMRCFELEDGECLVMAKWFSTACIEQAAAHMPNKISVDDGKKYGALIAHCTHDLYYTFMANKHKEGPNCPKPSGTDNTQSHLPDPTQPNDE